MTVLSSLCVMTTVAAMSSTDNFKLNTNSNKVVAVAYTDTNKGRAGVSAGFARTSVKAENNNGISVKDLGLEMVSSSMTSGQLTELSLTAEEKEWLNCAMPNVDDYLCVRADKNQDSEIVGKLYRGNKATVVEKGDVWTKITSGNLTGYVRNDMCVFGIDAYNFAKANCETVATSKTEGLRVRATQDVNGQISTVVDNGAQLTVDTAAQTQDGWVAVKVGDATCFVSKEFVDVTMKTGNGVTLEEEAAAQAAEKAAREQAEQAAAAKAAEEASKAELSESSSRQQSTTTRTQGSALAANASDVTLLAALIQCEAGGESYECQLAVGSVVVNRVHSGYGGGTLYGVIYQRGQFGPAMTGKLERTLAKGPNSTSVRAAQEALSGVDNVNGCRNFRDTSSSNRSGIVIGGMVFF